MEFFKSVIQIPDLPDVGHSMFIIHVFVIELWRSMRTWLLVLTSQAPPNFLRAAALAEYKKPVVVMPNEERHEDDDVEPQPEFREQQTPQVCLLHPQVNVLMFPV